MVCGKGPLPIRRCRKFELRKSEKLGLRTKVLYLELVLDLCKQLSRKSLRWNPQSHIAMIALNLKSYIQIILMQVQLLWYSEYRLATALEDAKAPDLQSTSLKIWIAWRREEAEAIRTGWEGPVDKKYSSTFLCAMLRIQWYEYNVHGCWISSHFLFICYAYTRKL